MEIESYFSKYDLDGNRDLSYEEQMKMREDLKNQFNKIDQDMTQLKTDAEIAKMKADAEIDKKYLHVLY